jgi:GxGYxYP putative glycoside hydrolase C-terminal domain
MDADATALHAMANASFFQHYPLKNTYRQSNLPSRESLSRDGLIDSENRVTSRSYVSIYVGDYDSASWLYQNLPQVWDDPVRGTIPLGWAFNPNLSDRFPFGMAWARENAGNLDTFICGDSGAGYLNPGFLTPPRKWSGLPSGLRAWEKHCAKYYHRWGLSVTGFIIDGYSPYMSRETADAYSGFSHDGFVVQRRDGHSTCGLIGTVPYIQMTEDLAEPEEGARKIAATAPAGVGFAVYRTILWSPGQHKLLYDRVRELRPDIEIVEPHTLMLLLRTHLGSRSRQPL